jgi:3-hydroxypropanoate dehydrogenase
MTENVEPAVAAARRAMMAVKERITALDDRGLDLILREARSMNGFVEGPVTDAELRRLYDIVKMGPTSGNCSPARILFLRSAAEKERLRPALEPGNVDKTLTAAVVAIVGYDTEYWRHFGKLFPHRAEAVTKRHGGNPAFAEATAFRNGTLQGAYLMIAARAIGLDCGAMSGIDNAMIDRTFFAGTTIKSNFLVTLGRGDPSKIFQRLYRFEFDEVCKIV